MAVFKEVFILGAGFTRAFLPKAPLLVDNYGIEGLIRKYRSFPKAAGILISERSKYEGGLIDIESLMTRLHIGMPHDVEHQGQSEFSLLLSEVKNHFIKRLENAKKGRFYTGDMVAFARYCIENHVDCITFNYDDIFDQALFDVKRALSDINEPYWHPDGGYGFFCRPSCCCVEDTSVFMDKTAMKLLKLHGSMNWFVRLGYSSPFVLESIVHHEQWLPLQGHSENLAEEIILHIEKEPFIIPPLLVKSEIMQQPILRLVWRLSYDILKNAERVTFIGYSMPATDIAAGYLFNETLMNLPTSAIKIVALSSNYLAKKRLVESYRKVFPRIRRNQFDFRDALIWARELSNVNPPQNA